MSVWHIRVEFITDPVHKPLTGQPVCDCFVSSSGRVVRQKLNCVFFVIKQDHHVHCFPFASIREDMPLMAIAYFHRFKTRTPLEDIPLRQRAKLMAIIYFHRFKTRTTRENIPLMQRSQLMVLYISNTLRPEQLERTYRWCKGPSSCPL